MQGGWTHGEGPLAPLVRVVSDNPIFGGLLVANLRARGLRSELAGFAQLSANGPGPQRTAEALLLVDMGPYDPASDDHDRQVVQRLLARGAPIVWLVDDTWGPRRLGGLPGVAVFSKAVDLAVLMRTVVRLVSELAGGPHRRSP